MICIVSVFKNESHLIREWLDHHINEGVDTFFLTDNGSTDTYDIKDYIDNGKVILRIDDTPYSQNEHLNYYLKDVKKYDWVIVIDLDEFVYSRLGFKTIKDYLQTVGKDIYLIRLPWKLFGSNNKIKQPKSVIKGFTRRKKYIQTYFKREFIEQKCIARGSTIISLHIHTPTIKNLNEWNHQSMACNYIPLHFLPINEHILKTSFLHLNHYRIQSWDRFKKKMIRGDAMTKKIVRDKFFFNSCDFNDKLDTELKNKRK